MQLDGVGVPSPMSALPAFLILLFGRKGSILPEDVAKVQDATHRVIKTTL
jgi:hypothetical protein